MAGQGDDDRDDLRSIADDGTQENAQAPVGGDGGRSSYGPPPSVGGKQEPGGAVPPYEGRRESADVDESGSHRDGANVGGATGPVVDDKMKAPSPSDTEGGRSASPGGEPPKTEDDADYEADPGVGPAHVAGTPKGEESGA